MIIWENFDKETSGVYCDRCHKDLNISTKRLRDKMLLYLPQGLYSIVKQLSIFLGRWHIILTICKRTEGVTSGVFYITEKSLKEHFMELIDETEKR